VALVGEAVVALDQVQLDALAGLGVGDAGAAVDGGVLAAVDDGDGDARLGREVGEVLAAVEEADSQGQLALGAVVEEQAGAVAAPGGDALGAEAGGPAREEGEGGGDQQQAADPRRQPAGGEQGRAVAALYAAFAVSVGNKEVAPGTSANGVK